MKSISLILILGVLLRLMLAVINSIIPINVSGSLNKILQRLDGYGFHHVGELISFDLSFSLISNTKSVFNNVFYNAPTDFEIYHRMAYNIYPAFLGIVYFLTYDSIFIGQLTSIFFWIISFYTLFKILNMLGVSYKSQCYALLIFSFLPSTIIYTFATIREPMQLMFVLIFFFQFLNFIYFKKFRSLFISMIALFFLYKLHFTLAFGIIFALFVILFVSILRKYIRTFNIKITLLVILLCSLISFYFLDLYFNIFGISNRYVNTSLISHHYYEIHPLNKLVSFIRGSINDYYDARSNYRENIDYFIYYSDVIYHIVTSFFLYNFSPFFLSIKSISIIDIPLILENFLRISIITFSIVALIFKKIENKSFYLFALIFLISIEIMWSAGTSSWGTASRHHVPVVGLLAILSTIYFNNNFLSKNHESR